jgi:hypothetical protein
VILGDGYALRFYTDGPSTDVDATVGYSLDDGAGTITPTTAVAASNGTSPVVLVADPGAAGAGARISYLSIRSRYTATTTVTVETFDGGVGQVRIVAAALAPLEHLIYTPESGWSVRTSGLQVKVTSSAAIAGTGRVLMKTGTAAEAAASWYCTAKDAGVPGAIAVGAPGLAGRAVLGSTEGGSIALPTPSGSWHLTHCALASTVIHAHMVFDLLWINSGIVVTTTTAQTVNSVAFPARDAQGTVNGEGCAIGLLFTAAATNAAAISTSTVSYTDSAGTAGRTATLVAVAGSQIPATPVIGTLVWFHLAAGDKGVQSIQSVTLATSLVTGSVSLIVARPIAMVPSSVANVATPALIDAEPGICVWDNPAIFHCYQASATTATATAGTLAFTDRP